MNTKRMVAVLAVLVMAFAAFAFVSVGGDTVASDEKEIVYMHGDVTSKLMGTKDQKVIIDQDMTIKENGMVVIQGELLVEKGVTVTIEAGMMYISGDSVIDGDIVSKKSMGLNITPQSADVVVNGSISAIGNASGTLVTQAIVLQGNSQMTVNGTVTVGTNAGAMITAIHFEKGSKLVILGTVYGYVDTDGYVCIDGDTYGMGFNINMTHADAVVDVISVTGIGLTVSDSGLYAYTYGGADYYVAKSSNRAIDSDFKTIDHNTEFFVDVTNIRITESVATQILYDESESVNKMTAETMTIISPIDASKNVKTVDGELGRITFIRGSTACLESMTISDLNVVVTGSVTSTISGDVTFLLSDLKDAGGNLTQIITVDTGAKLKVDGLLLIKKDDIRNNGIIIAAHYTVKDADNNTDNCYTTIQRAIDNGVTDITMMGQLVVEKDLTVPAGVTLTTSDSLTTTPAESEEDYAVVIREGATFEIANGAQFCAKGEVDVKGVFAIENMNYGITLGTIYADVMKKNDVTCIYTNIYEAFADANVGDEINAYNPSYEIIQDEHLKTIVMDRDIILPDGVLFDNVSLDGNKIFILVKNGATLTVDGTFCVSSHYYLMSEDVSTFAPPEVDGKNGWNDKTPSVDASTGSVQEYSVIAIGSNGLIAFDNSSGGCHSMQTSTLYSIYKISGAYFENDTSVDAKKELYISNAPLAFAGILGVKDNRVDIFGSVSFDNLKVSGTEKERITVNIATGSEVTMKNFTFAYGTVNVAVGVTLTGDLGTATGKMIFNDAIVRGAAVFKEVFINDAMNLEVSGTIASSNATQIAGIVYLKGLMCYPQNVDPAVYTQLTYIEKRFVVPAGAVAFIEGSCSFSDIELLVEGELTIMKGATLIVDDESFLSVTGTLTVPKIDNGAGNLVAAKIIVGGSTDCFNAISMPVHGNALITGDGNITVGALYAVYVFNGANVDADVLADWMGNTKSTEFYMDGTLWMTAYASDNYGVIIAETKKTTVLDETVIETEYNLTPVVENMKFNGWQTYDEKTKTYKAVEAEIDDLGTVAYVYVGDAGFEKIYADLSKNIYDVKIISDIGIDDIFIDGKIILKDKTSNTFTEKISAGTHTIAYTLANGYSGNASITAIDGKTVSGSGLTFVIDDDKAGADMKMEITVSGIEKSGYDTDPETHDEKATGLTTTEILLIVAVIIMAIMAVVLILRLNRS